MFTSEECQLLAACRLEPDHIPSLIAPTGDLDQDRLLYEFARRARLLDAVATIVGDEIALSAHGLAAADQAASSTDWMSSMGLGVTALTAVCAPAESVRLRFAFNANAAGADLDGVSGRTLAAPFGNDVPPTQVGVDNPLAEWETADLRAGDTLVLPSGTSWVASASASARILRQRYVNGLAGQAPNPPPTRPETAIDLRGNATGSALDFWAPPPKGRNDGIALARSQYSLGVPGSNHRVVVGRTDVSNDLVVTLHDAASPVGDEAPPLVESLIVALDDLELFDGGPARTLHRGAVAYLPALTFKSAFRVGGTRGRFLRLRWTGAPQGYADPIQAQIIAPDNGYATTYLSTLTAKCLTLARGERLPLELRAGDTFLVLLQGKISIAGEPASAPALVVLPVGVPVDVKCDDDVPALMTRIEMIGQVKQLAVVRGVTPATLSPDVAGPDTPSVYFCIPLMARARANDWRTVCRHLDATLASIYQQTDPNWRILVVGSDAPDLTVKVDQRFEFLSARTMQAGEGRDAGRRDSGYKRWLGKREVAERGGGFLMFCDADDLIERSVVAFVRRTNHPFGYIVGRGLLYDAARGRASPLPMKSALTRSFDQHCGTCGVFRVAGVDPNGVDASDFHVITGHQGHPAYRSNMYLAGRPLMELPFMAVGYVRFTTENLSDLSDLPDAGERSSLKKRILAAMAAEPLRLDADTANAFSIGTLRDPAPTTRTFGPARLSVLVCTHRRPEGLGRLLTSLQPQIEGRWDRELIVVNDGTHDADYDAVLASYRHFLHYEPLAANVGIAKARNRSAALARGDFLVFVDDDCVAPPHWLDWLESRLAMHPELDVVGGTTRPLDLDAANFVGRVQGHYDLLPRPHRLTTGEQLFVTACLAVRAEAFHAVDGFGTGPLFAIAGEDSDLSVRLMRAKVRSRVDMEWHVFHVLSRKLLPEIRRYRRYGRVNGLLATQPEAPKAYRLLAHRRTRDLPSAFDYHFRVTATRAASFSSNPWLRLVSRLVGATILSSYDLGFISGLTSQRRDAKLPRN